MKNAVLTQDDIKKIAAVLDVHSSTITGVEAFYGHDFVDAAAQICVRTKTEEHRFFWRTRADAQDDYIYTYLKTIGTGKNAVTIKVDRTYDDCHPWEVRSITVTESYPNLQAEPLRTKSGRARKFTPRSSLRKIKGDDKQGFDDVVRKTTGAIEHRTPGHVWVRQSRETTVPLASDYGSDHDFVRLINTIVGIVAVAAGHNPYGNPGRPERCLPTAKQATAANG